MLEVDLHTFEWRQPYFCTVQKETLMAQQNVQSLKKRTEGKRNRERIRPVSKKEALVIYICFMVICFINNILTTVWACLNTSFVQI